MKQLALFMIAITAIFTPMSVTAQCTFISPTVDINTTTISGPNCIVNFNLSFDLITNSGNKIIYLHLWQLNDYPNHDYSCNQCQPTYSVNDNHGHKDLLNAVLNVAINNFAATPVFLTSYGPDAATPMQSPSNNPGMTIVKTTSTTAGAERFIISNINVTVPGACNNNIVFKGDAWSSNSNSSSASVQCAMQGFAVGLTDPVVSGACVSGVPRKYNFTISTISSTRQVYYDVYLDNGNGILDPSNDSLIGSLPVGSAVTITPSTPYNSGLISYPSAAGATAKKIYVVVATVGQSYLISTEITPCGALPLAVTFKNFYATRSNDNTVALNWQTGSEKDLREFVIEHNTADAFVQTASVAASNSPTGNSYTFNDPNSNLSASYYRIKAVNNDGTYSYSAIQQVKGAGRTGDISIYPNPAKGTAQITLGNVSAPVTVQVIDNAGRLVKTIIATKNTVELDGLTEGIYMIRVVDNSTGSASMKTLAVTN